MNPVKADMVVEAVPENLDVKKTVLQEAGEHAPDALYASNTSSIPITQLAEYVPNPANMVGFHFFNPAPVMPLIELVVTGRTNAATIDAATAVADQLEKTVATVKDTPGFASNKMLMAFINEAVKLLESGVASKHDIDVIAENGFNHPMGPLKLADFIGLDVCTDILERIHENTGEERFTPTPLLVEKVEQGLLGRKTGEGFYTYEVEQA